MIQLHLSSPRMWKPPRLRPDADELRRSGRVISAHAPYLCNPASPDLEVRTRTERLLQETLDAASRVGAGGVVVHAGHAGPTGTVEEAVDRWLELLSRLESSVPLWIENTASGRSSPGRRLDDLRRFFATIRSSSPRLTVGCCLDVAHAFAGDPATNEEPDEWVRGLADAAGRIDLVHVNDSGVDAGAGRDRHTNLGLGRMGLATIGAMVVASHAPAAVLETPGGTSHRRQDLAILHHLVGREYIAPIDT